MGNQPSINFFKQIADQTNANNNALRGSGYRMPGMFQGGGGGATPGPLEIANAERGRMLGANNEVRDQFSIDPYSQQNMSFFQQDPFQSLMAMLQGRASGADRPFDQTAMAGFTGRADDAAAGRNQADSRGIRQQMARRGQSGSNQEYAALMNARRGTAHQLRGSIRDINSRATLENFQAKTQAQSQLNDTMFRQLEAQRGMNTERLNARERGAEREIGIRGRQRIVT